MCSSDLPGISVIHLLDELGLTYTGSDAAFYEITTSKIVMKRAFERAVETTGIRKILQIRKKKREEYQEEQSILEVYMQALGMI